MGAYNWIKTKAICPACNQQVELRCQTHVASDYDGDDTGRFHDREYNLGEALKWWPKDDKRYSEWRMNGLANSSKQGEVDYEACYVSCPSCNADLYAVIEFEGPCSKAVKEIGLESNWPTNFTK